MAAIWLMARAHLRRHWRSAVVVALLAGLAGAAVLAALAGARRTRSSVARLDEATKAPDAFVNIPSDDLLRVDPALLDRMSALPEIEALAPFGVMYMLPEGIELAPGRELSFVATVGTDERLGREILVPRIIEGRRARPDRPDEAVFNEASVAALDVGVGDTVRFTGFTPTQFFEAEATGADPGEPAGPTVDITVVGIGRSSADLFAGENLDNFPVLLTPALYERYRDAIATQEGFIVARLRSRDDAATLSDSLTALVGEDATEVAGVASRSGGSLVQAIDTESLALLLFAAAVGLAGLVAVGQALGRQLAATVPDHAVLAALGTPPGARWAVGFVVALPMALAGAALSVAGAVVASPRLPFGLGGRAEPDPGIAADALVLGVGGLAVAVVVLALAGAIAWRVVRLASTARAADDVSWAPRRSIVARQLTRAGLPPTPDIGVRMALETGHGRTAVPVRPALAGAVIGVGGIVAALVVGASLTRLVDSPERYGWNWDVAVAAGTDAGGADEIARDLSSDRDVAAIATVETARVQVEGRGLTSIGLTSVDGSIEPTVVDGRTPRARDEVALGTETMERVGRSIGDTVTVGSEGRARELRIVGQVVLPALDTDEPANGAVVAGDITRLRAPDAPEARQDVLVRFGPAVDVDAAIARLEPTGLDVITTRRPVDVDTLAEVDVVTVVLAGVLAALGVVALAHSLAMTVQRRRREVAVLETLGFVTGQVRGAVAWQATVVAAVGVAVGVPLGFAGGRWVWEVLARGIGMGTDPAVPVLGIAVAVVLTLLLANAVAAWPARAAARVQPATALRTE